MVEYKGLHPAPMDRKEKERSAGGYVPKRFPRRYKGLGCLHFLLLLLLSPAAILTVKAQTFGGNPSSLQWRRLDKESIRVIFPEGQEAPARRIMALARWQQQHDTVSIGGQSRAINIVLQPQVTFSNGYVGLGPFRSEFYLMPPMDAFALGAQDWTANLAIHEFRHIQQYRNFRTGLSRAASLVFGEDGQALFNAMAVPNWFFEGDAVYNETKLSRQGRGRLPLFMNAYKSLFVAGKNYSYQKLRNGSYRDYVPDHYALGYLLVGYGYEKYGDAFWKKVTQDAAAFRPLFYPLQGALKKQTGITYSAFVKEALEAYKQAFGGDADTAVQWLTPPAKNGIVHYRYPLWHADGSLLALKTGTQTIPSFSLLKNGKEKKLATAAISYDPYFAANESTIVYSAYQPDTRWGNREYSVIRLLDRHSGRDRRMTSRTRYFTPDISRDDSSVAVAALTEKQASSLVLLRKNGKPYWQYAAGEGEIFSYPKFLTGDSSLLVLTRNRKGWMGIDKIDIATRLRTVLLAPANRIVGLPVVSGDTVLFSLSAGGKDAIAAIDLSSNTLFHVSSYTTGLYGADKKKDSLVAAAFTANGYRLGLFPQHWKKQDFPQDDTLRLIYPEKLAGSYNLLDAGLSDSDSVPSLSYAKSAKLFNFHSLHPQWDDPDYSLTLYSENILNTLQSQLFYNYNRNEHYSTLGLTGIYGGWYLQPVVGITGTFKRQSTYQDRPVNWNEYNAIGGLQLPLNFSGGKMYRYLTLSSVYHYNRIYWTGDARSLFKDGSFQFQESRIYYAAQIQQATQQIYPHGGYTFSLLWRQGLSGNAHQLLASSNIYLPGIVNTHSLVLNLAWTKRDTLSNYRFTNNFPFSRGYSLVDLPLMWKLGGNYHLPLAYPDWGLGNIVYFLRIRANLFYDYTLGKSLRTQQQYHFRTAGTEIYFDTKWWNQEPVTFGIRYSRMVDHRLLGTGINRWEFILPLSLF